MLGSNRTLFFISLEERKAWVWWWCRVCGWRGGNSAGGGGGGGRERGEGG